MLRSNGLGVISHPGHELYLCEPDRHNPACFTTWDKEELLAATGLA